MLFRSPVSAHVAALGGDNISLIADDASLVFHNPALINDVSDRSIGLNFMTYMEGAKTASAALLLGGRLVFAARPFSFQLIDLYLHR